MNFKRGLLVSASVIGAAFLVKALFQKDIARYNSLAEMSDDKPLLTDQIEKLKELVGVGGRSGSN